MAKPNPGSKDPDEFPIDSLPDEIKIGLKNFSGPGRTRDRPDKRPNNGWYSHKKKLDTACAYALLGSVDKVVELVKIPKSTIRTWMRTEWWHEIIGRVKNEANDALDAKITASLDKAMDVINDRLENGDFVYNIKKGEIQRKPVSIRDATYVTAQMVDKRQLLRGEPTSVSGKVSENEKLVRLAEEFKKFAQAKEIKQVSAEVEKEDIENAIEEGEIQEGDLSEYSDGDESWEESEAGDSNSDVESWEDEEETLTINQLFSE